MKSDSTASPRNLQLDFFRGLALMIIFINHMPGNPWFAYTPSRLGLSDSAETFVFLSGFAAAIAFGRTFSTSGIALGSIRVLYRCGQIYIAHVVLFIMMASLFLGMNHLSFANVQWQLDNLNYFFDHTPEALLALISLQYVPNFIDILPMYFVIMLWLPIVWTLSRIHVGLALAFSLSLYMGASIYGWELTADPLSGRPWYFNPFCWQLVFFTGFALSSGWLPIPRPHRGLIILCLIYAVFCYPLENRFGYSRLPWFAAFREDWKPLLSKGHEGILRYLHFLAMAYLVNSFMYARQHWLQSKPAGLIIRMGQQSLPVFMFGTCLSCVGGMLLDGTQADLIDSLWINLAGLGLMVTLANFLNWLDKKPWKNPVALRETSHDWATQAALACSLIVITITPMALLQTQTQQTETPMIVAIAPEAVTTPPDIAVLETDGATDQDSVDTFSISSAP
ncbi:OpgC family protein [Methylomonas sp. MgM2]